MSNQKQAMPVVQENILLYPRDKQSCRLTVGTPARYTWFSTATTFALRREVCTLPPLGLGWRFPPVLGGGGGGKPRLAWPLGPGARGTSPQGFCFAGFPPTREPALPSPPWVRAWARKAPPRPPLEMLQAELREQH